MFRKVTIRHAIGMQSLAVTARLQASGRDEHCYRYTTDLYIIYTVTADRAGVDIDGRIFALDLQGEGGGSPLKIIFPTVYINVINAQYKMCIVKCVF